MLGRGDDVGGCVAERRGLRRLARQRSTSAPLFLPYLSGERTPHNDAAATGLFAGLRAEHGAEALVYAVMEGVAFAFADGVDVLERSGRAADRSTMLVGGGRAHELLGRRSSPTRPA